MVGLSFSEGNIMRVWYLHLFMRVSHPVFEKPGIAPVLFRIVLNGFKMVSHYGIDNRRPLDVVIIPNYDVNDSAVSYSHMRT